jgi:hypothetical protein
MIVIRHQYIGVDLHPIPLRGFFKTIEKFRPILIVVEYRLSPLSPRGDVIPPARYIDP